MAPAYVLPAMMALPRGLGANCPLPLGLDDASHKDEGGHCHEEVELQGSFAYYLKHASLMPNARVQRRDERAARGPSAGTRCWAPSADHGLILPSFGPMERSATSVS